MPTLFKKGKQPLVLNKKVCDVINDQCRGLVRRISFYYGMEFEQVDIKSKLQKDEKEQLMQLVDRLSPLYENYRITFDFSFAQKNDLTYKDMESHLLAMVNAACVEAGLPERSNFDNYKTSQESNENNAREESKGRCAIM